MRKQNKYTGTLSERFEIPMNYEQYYRYLKAVLKKGTDKRKKNGAKKNNFKPINVN